MRVARTETMVSLLLQAIHMLDTIGCSKQEAFFSGIHTEITFSFTHLYRLYTSDPELSPLVVSHSTGPTGIFQRQSIHTSVFTTNFSS